MSFYLVNDSFAWQLLTVAPDLGAPWRRGFWPRGFRIEPKPKTRHAAAEVLNASHFQMSDWRQLQHLLVHRLGAEPRRARTQRAADYCVTVAPHRSDIFGSHCRGDGCAHPVHRGHGAPFAVRAHDNRLCRRDWRAACPGKPMVVIDVSDADCAPSRCSNPRPSHSSAHQSHIRTHRTKQSAASSCAGRCGAQGPARMRTTHCCGWSAARPPPLCARRWEPART